MKTTIDFPEEILRRAKIVAAQRQTTLKELVIAGLNHALDTPPEQEEIKRRQRASRLIAALSKGRNTEPIGPLDRDELYAKPSIPRISITAKPTTLSK